MWHHEETYTAVRKKKQLGDPDGAVAFVPLPPPAATPTAPKNARHHGSTVTGPSMKGKFPVEKS